MATTKTTYREWHPQLVGQLCAFDEHVDPSEGVGAYMASYLIGQLMAKDSFPAVGGMFPYTAAQWTVTSSGTGAAQAQAVTAGGGILLTAGSTSTFYSGLQSKAVVTPATGKVFSLAARVRVSHATQIGFNIGFANAQADPTGTEYTDFVGFRKDPTSATIKATVIGNASGVPVQSSSLYTPVAATEFLLAMWFNLNATAASVDGGFMCGLSSTGLLALRNSITRLGSITSAGAEAAAILTTPPTDWGLTLFGTGTTGNNPTMTITSAMAMVDNAL